MPKKFLTILVIMWFPLNYILNKLFDIVKLGFHGLYFLLPRLSKIYDPQKYYQGKLIEVNEKYHRRSLCTELVLENKKTSIYMKIATFDSSGEITKKAKALIGKRIGWTTHATGLWSRDEYFKNIFEIV